MYILSYSRSPAQLVPLSSLCFMFNETNVASSDEIIAGLARGEALDLSLE